MEQTEQNKLRQRLITLIEQIEKPIDINFIARHLNIHWFTAYRLVTDMVLEEVQKHPEFMQKLPFVCLKSTKSLVVMANRLLPYQEG